MVITRVLRVQPLEIDGGPIRPAFSTCSVGGDSGTAIRQPVDDLLVCRLSLADRRVLTACPRGLPRDP